MNDASLQREITDLACDLIAFASTADHPSELKAAIDYVEQYARQIDGVLIRRYEVEQKPGLMVTLRDTHTPALLLNGHLDVVAARSEQYRPVVRDGRIYGRGSQDMKGACAVLMRLMKDLAAAPQPPDVGFMYVTDEEIGGFHGTSYLLEQGWRTRFFIAAEPTDLNICYAAKGMVRFDVTLHGKPAHGSRPWDGVNPILLLRDGLQALERRFPTPTEAVWETTAVPTVVRGGETLNRIPEMVTLSLDIRHIPEETPDEIEAAVRACFPGATVVRNSNGGIPLLTDPNDPHLAHLAASVERITGRRPTFYREHYGSDARFYSGAGIPAICFGPVGAGLHSDEEWVDIASLERLYRILYDFARVAAHEDQE